MTATDPDETLPSVLTVREFMDVARCSKSKVYRLIRKREVPAVKVGKRLLILKSAVHAMLTPEGPK